MKLHQSKRSNKLVDVRLWHQPDQRGRSDDVRCSGQTGSGRLGVKSALLTQHDVKPDCV
jgi:hypothetical protein